MALSDVTDLTLFLHERVDDTACPILAEATDCPETGLGTCLTVALKPGSYAVIVGSDFAPAAYSLEVTCGSEFVRGDANQDGLVTHSDANRILGALFSNCPDAPSNELCEDAADVNDDGEVTPLDAVALIRCVYFDDGRPELPFPSPGPDPTDDDDLTCDSYRGTPPDPVPGFIFEWQNDPRVISGQVGVEATLVGQTPEPLDLVGWVYLLHTGLFKNGQENVHVDLVAPGGGKTQNLRSRVVEFDDPRYPEISEDYDLLLFQANFGVSLCAGGEDLTLPALDEATPVFRVTLDVVDAIPAQFIDTEVDALLPLDRAGVDPTAIADIKAVTEFCRPGGDSHQGDGGSGPLTTLGGVGSEEFLFAIRGDANHDGDINIADATYTLEWMFLTQAPEPTCYVEADTNFDKAIDIIDPVYTLFALFMGTVPLVTGQPEDGDCLWEKDLVRWELGCFSNQRPCPPDSFFHPSD